MEEYKIVIVDSFHEHESNKGDIAIIMGMIQSIRTVIPKARFSLISTYSESDPRYENAYFYLKKDFPYLNICGSPIPYKSWSKILYASKLKLPYRTGMRMWWLIRSLFYLLVIRSHKFTPNKEAVQALREADIVLLAGGHYLLSLIHI